MVKVIFATRYGINAASMVILLWGYESYPGFRVTDTEKYVSEKLVGLGVELDVKVKGGIALELAWKGIWKGATSFIYPFGKYLLCARHRGASYNKQSGHGALTIE